MQQPDADGYRLGGKNGEAVIPLMSAFGNIA